MSRRSWPCHPQNTECSEGCRVTQPLPPGSTPGSQSLTHNSKYTPPCTPHRTLSHSHAASTLQHPYLLGETQQLGCAGAEVLSELARQSFPCGENLQDPARVILNSPASPNRPHASGPDDCASPAQLADQAGTRQS